MALHLDAIGKAQWLFTKIKFFKQFEGRPIAQYSRKDYLTHRDRAFSLAKERIGHFNGFYGYKFNKINIKNQKTRWGSCSKRGNLNFLIIKFCSCHKDFLTILLCMSCAILENLIIPENFGIWSPRPCPII